MCPKNSPNARRQQQYLHRATVQRPKVKERLAIRQFILVLDLPPLVFQMQNSPSLWMVQRGGPIEQAENESGEHCAGDGLQSESTVIKRRFINIKL